MAFLLESFVITHIGNRRKNNEDNFFNGEILTPEEQSQMSQTNCKYVARKQVADLVSNKIFAVSDGMGGHEYGEVASFLTVSSLKTFCEKNMAPSKKRCEKFEFIQAFQSMLGETNGKINAYAAEKNAANNMGATVSGLIVFADEAAAFNIGDSSVFLFENNKPRKLTVDDNEREIFKNIDPSALNMGGKTLTKYLGFPASSGVLTANITEPIPLKVGQIYMIVSDGLTDALSVCDIKAVISKHSNDIEKAAQTLLETALTAEKGGRDNITILIIKIKK